MMGSRVFWIAVGAVITLAFLKYRGAISSLNPLQAGPAAS